MCLPSTFKSWFGALAELQVSQVVPDMGHNVNTSAMKDLAKYNKWEQASVRKWSNAVQSHEKKIHL